MKKPKTRKTYVEMVQFRCVYCGNWRTRKTETQRTCSDACRSGAYKRRQAGKPEALPGKEER